MRDKLTAKHPRSASAERAPVRPGSASARKPVRPKPAAPGDVKRGAGSSSGAAGSREPRAKAASPTGGKRPASKPAGAAGERRAAGDRPPRRDEPSAGGSGAPRRGADDRDRTARAPRFARDGDSPRPYSGARPANRGADDTRRPAPRSPRSTDAAPRGERPARRERDEGASRGSAGDTRRPYGGARSADRRADDTRRPAPRSPRSTDAAPRGERPARRERDEGASRSSAGETRRPYGGARSADRGADDTRRPAPRFGRPTDAAPRDARPARRERDESRDRSDGPRTRAADDRGAPGRSERPFARPVKTSYADRPERAPRDERAPRAGAKRGPDDRASRPERTERARDNEAPGARRFADRDRAAPGKKPARGASPIARTPRATEAAHERAPRPEREYHDAPGTLRLSKLMSELGLCSRREADEWIERGWVLVDGVRIDTLGSKVRPNQRIDIDPAAQNAQSQQVTILVHKPVGYVSGQAEDGYQPAITLVTPDNRWEGDRSEIRFAPVHLRQLAPAGRLDIDSTGLLVLTQDGRVAKQLIGGHSEIDKEYLVRVSYGEVTTEVDQHFPPEDLAQLRHGLELDGVPLKAAMVSWQNGEQLRFVLREGKKRQIRRMCELVGLQVVGLKRVRMGRVTLGAMPPGQWRYLSADESF
ncbi:MAG TPA: pseudouridine synthase [Paraburkholderia sp.]|jgi:23S rRNA pseudouridine2604 synthase